MFLGDEHCPTSAKQQKLSLDAMLCSLVPANAQSSRPRPTCLSRVEAELDLYLTLPLLQDDQLDVLNYWKNSMSQLEMLSSCARKFLCSNATSCASERLFSFAGHIVNKKRSCLNPQMADMLAFLAFNTTSGDDDEQ